MPRERAVTLSVFAVVLLVVASPVTIGGGASDASNGVAPAVQDDNTTTAANETTTTEPEKFEKNTTEIKRVTATEKAETTVEPVQRNIETLIVENLVMRNVTVLNATMKTVEFEGGNNTTISADRVKVTGTMQGVTLQNVTINNKSLRQSIREQVGKIPGGNATVDRLVIENNTINGLVVDEAIILEVEEINVSQQNQTVQAQAQAPPAIEAQMVTVESAALDRLVAVNLQQEAVEPQAGANETTAGANETTTEA